jgi:hypothetical protein
MGKHQYFWETTDEAAPTDDYGPNWFVSCLQGSVLVFPGLAVLVNRWLPDGFVMQCVPVFFSAQALAQLLLNEIKGYDEDELF